MMYYNICDLIIKMEPDDITRKNAEKYKIPSMDYFDISVDSSIETAKREIKTNMSNQALCYLSAAKDFYRKLLNFNGTYIHASSVVVDDKAYLFSAPCGTGKSTHTSKWLELFGDKAYILNDDKPAIRILDDGIYAYGTPWSGKCDISVNKKVKLQSICFLQRDNYNWINVLDLQKTFFELYRSSMKKISKVELEKQMGIFDCLIKRIPIYEMGCTPTIEAAQMAYDVMSKGEVK